MSVKIRKARTATAPAKRISHALSARLDARAAKVIKRPLALNDPRFIDAKAKAATELANTRPVPSARLVPSAPAPLRKPPLTYATIMAEARRQAISPNRMHAKQSRPRPGTAEIDEILKQNRDTSEKAIGKELTKRGIVVNWRTLKDRVYRRRKQLKPR